MQKTSNQGGSRRNFSRGNNGVAPRGGRPMRGKSKRPTNTIASHRFVNRAVEREAEPEYVPTNTFEDFALNAKIKSTLAFLGFTAPSAIQDQAIAPALEGKDVIGLANTGTGKTAAFLLPIIEKLSKQPIRNSVLILSPTRELSQQIDAEFKRFAAGQKLYSAVCVGGANIGRQIRELQRNPHVIIATPGRLKDLIERRIVVLGEINTFVLDEADRMLDMGFVHDIRRVAELLPRERQTMCFSATMTPDVKVIMDEFMREPVIVSVRRGETSDHIDQDIVEVTDKDDKLEKLVELLHKDELEKTIIFCETKFGSQRLADRLSKEHLPAVAIHGNKSQSQRERALKAFKTNAVNIMVATDVAARGLDIPNVSHVINYDVPQSYDDYVHRIGRTGRGGQSGSALTFVPKQKSGVSKQSRQQRAPRSNASEQTAPMRQKPRRFPTSKQREDSLMAAIEELS